MGVVLGLLFGIIFMIVGIILLLNPKNYSKKGLLREINEILEQANKELKEQKRIHEKQKIGCLQSETESFG